MLKRVLADSPSALQFGRPRLGGLVPPARPKLPRSLVCREVGAEGIPHLLSILPIPAPASIPEDESAQPGETRKERRRKVSRRGGSCSRARAPREETELEVVAPRASNQKGVSEKKPG